MKSNFEIRTLHIHVSTTVSVEDLHQYDTEIAGVYAAEVDASLPDGLAAWAALEAFHQKIGIKQLDDFSCEVFDPDTSGYITQVEPDDQEGIYYRYCGKLADELPRTTLRLTLDVSYFAGGLSAEVLIAMLNRMVEQGISNGGLTGSSNAEVVEHSYSVIEVIDEPEALSPEYPLESRTDYKLSEQVKGCWITVGTAGVHVIRTDYGVSVEIEANDGGIEPLASVDVSFDTLENEICECQGVDLYDVRLQHEFEHPTGPAFDSLQPVERAAIIKQVAKSTAQVVASIAKEPASNDSENGDSWPLAQIFASGPLL